MRTGSKSPQTTRPVICRMATTAFGLLLGVLPSLTIAQEMTLTITVRHLDSGQPVPSVIWQITHEGEKALNETDKEGQLKLNMECAQGTTIQAQPVSKAYHFSKAVYCQGKKKIEFSVTSISTAFVLQKNLSEAEAAQDFKTAAHIATELSRVNLRSGEGIAGTKAERLAYEYTAKALSVHEDAAFDRQQDMYVMAQALQENVSNFQRECNIKVTGRLDPDTLRELSGKTGSELRHDSYTRFETPGQLCRGRRA